MESPERPSLRDIGILAHIDAGKTSLTERLLYVSGSIREAGDIDLGTTVTDYLDVERERGITVKAAAAHFEWERPPKSRYRINLIDTPGHVDFSSEVGRSLHALDGAVVLVCAVAGVQSRTEALYRACSRRGVSRLAFINKMDRRGASFERALGDIRSVLDPGALAVQLPWGEGEGFRGVLDLLDMVAYDFSESRLSSSSAFKRSSARPIPEELEAAAMAARSALAESLAEGDLSLLEDFVAGRPSAPSRLRAALRAATLSGRATPVLCGSAFSDMSAALLLDAVADYLPSPAEAFRPSGTESGTGASLVPGPDDPFSALVFKTGGDRHFGRLSWIRVRSGRIAAGDRVLDVGAAKLLRITRIFGIQADRLESADLAEDGDIVALAFAGAAAGQGAAAATGATLCDPGRPLLYERIGFGEPVMSIALEPRTREDGERFRAGAAALADEDPSIRIREDPQTGRIELSGMGELHLEVAVERLARDYGAAVRVGRPRVAYRELIKASAEGSEDFDRDLGGERARASLSLRVGPGIGAGTGAALPPFSFAHEASIRAVPSLMEAARRGAEASLSVGPCSGFPLESAQVLLTRLTIPGGSTSSPGKAAERAVEIAASLAALAALRAAGTEVVEPVMRLEIAVPDVFLGAAAAAVSGRGGRIESIDSSPGGGSLLSGAASLRRLFGFAGELRSCTEGRAEYSARFLRFEAVPPGFSDFG